MARVAFIMDRIFRQLRPVRQIASSRCSSRPAAACPAVMATKTIENEKDRRMTIMTTTMIPCGAKLPIIALVFGALAGRRLRLPRGGLPRMFYFLGVIAIILSGIMLKKTKLFAGEAAPFVMELPEYHMPTVKTVLLSMWERVKGYIIKAGTIIFLSTIVIWFLMNFGDAGEGFGLLDADAPDYMELQPHGRPWATCSPGSSRRLALTTGRLPAPPITGLVAKENVVATVGIITQLGRATARLTRRCGSASPPDARRRHGCHRRPSAHSTCCALRASRPWAPSASSMISAKWFWITIGYLCGFAWCVGLMIYQFVRPGDRRGRRSTCGLWWPSSLLPAMLFQIFRPMPKREEKQEKPRRAHLARPVSGQKTIDDGFAKT